MAAKRFSDKHWRYIFDEMLVRRRMTCEAIAAYYEQDALKTLSAAQRLGYIAVKKRRGPAPLGDAYVGGILRREYVQKRETFKTIGKRHSISPLTLMKYADKLGIQKRVWKDYAAPKVVPAKKEPSSRYSDDALEDILTEEYWGEELTLNELAARYECDRTVFTKAAKRLDIPLRTTSEAWRLRKLRLQED